MGPAQWRVAYGRFYFRIGASKSDIAVSWIRSSWRCEALSLPYVSKNIQNAVLLRKNMTSQERHLGYDFLRSYHPRFQRQKVIDRFIVDFYCAKALLAIEIDGSQHYTEDGRLYDADRTKALERYGVSVLRFTNDDIRQRFNEVCEMIHIAVQRRV